jgi:hypothetical protein
VPPYSFGGTLSANGAIWAIRRTDEGEVIRDIGTTVHNAAASP